MSKAYMTAKRVGHFKVNIQAARMLQKKLAWGSLPHHVM